MFKVVKTACAVLALGFSLTSQATIVEVSTNVGKFEINLYDQTTPLTVENFLKYVQADSYKGTVIHRSVPGFIVQGGGFKFVEKLPLVAAPVLSPVKNEPKLSNVRGTIAMAKISGNPDSATNQWFINLVDNSANLDAQNSGFTVFGQVSAQGMEIIDAVARLPRFNFSSVTDLPLQNYTAQDQAANKTLIANNFITIESITIVDSRVDTAAGLNPPKSTVNNSKPDSSNSSSGGSLGWFGLLAVFCLALRARLK